ncbi:GbsR/MarR family transcriptional regulator [Neisseria sp. Ec49-e6-T10]|uniref:GbsR/MarR family transcriptional regulator n=1 Tax=Neisseria sp. Ec49-e6-T10 TaxID=3140744 RepID=UPI003EBC4F31
MELKPIAQKFILHWGEMGSKWGVNRTVAQIHALLFLAEKPLNAEEISATLNIARSNVSNSLKELQSWHLIHVVHHMGDRRDYFETSKDVWALVRAIFTERKEREFDPTVLMLQECVDSDDFKQEDAEVQKRIQDTLVLMKTMNSWADEMLRLSPETLLKVMKLGAKIQKLIRSDAK